MGSTFRANTTKRMRMIPLYQVMGEAYAVYFHTRRKAVPYAKGGAPVPSGVADMEYSKGVSVTGGPRDSRCSGSSVRTGAPWFARTRVTFAHPILGRGHDIARVSLAYRYRAGFTGGGNASVLSVVLVRAETETAVATLYRSPPLGNYSWDRGDPYSPLIEVRAAGLRVPNAGPLFLALEVDNNQRNLQLAVDDKAGGFNAVVHWDAGGPEPVPFSRGRGGHWVD